MLLVIVSFIIVFLLLGILSAFFSSAETALLSVNKYLLNAASAKNKKSAKIALQLLKNPTKLLSLVLLGNNLANVGLSALVTVFTVRFFGENAVIIASFFLTFVILIFMETIPKAFAVRYSYNLSLFFSYFIYPIQIALSPLISVINSIVTLVQRAIFRITRSDGEDKSHIYETLRGAIADSRTILEKSHADMLNGILNLDKIKAEEAMTPTVNIDGINIQDTEDQILTDLGKCNHNYAVVYEENISNCLGFVNVKNALLMHNLSQFSKQKLKSLIDEGEFIPESVFLLNLMKKLTQMDNPRAFIVDEYGEVQGIVTLRDVVSKVMGSINNLLIEELGSGIWRVNTDTLVSDINSRTGWNIGSQHLGVLSVRGLIQEQLEDFPQGAVCFQTGDYRFETEDAAGGIVSYAKIWMHRQERE